MEDKAAERGRCEGQGSEVVVGKVRVVSAIDRAAPSRQWVLLSAQWTRGSPLDLHESRTDRWSLREWISVEVYCVEQLQSRRNSDSSNGPRTEKIWSQEEDGQNKGLGFPFSLRGRGVRARGDCGAGTVQK